MPISIESDCVFVPVIELGGDVEHGINLFKGPLMETLFEELDMGTIVVPCAECEISEFDAVFFCRLRSLFNDSHLMTSHCGGIRVAKDITESLFKFLPISIWVCDAGDGVVSEYSRPKELHPLAWYTFLYE